MRYDNHEVAITTLSTSRPAYVHCSLAQTNHVLHGDVGYCIKIISFTRDSSGIVDMAHPFLDTGPRTLNTNLTNLNDRAPITRAVLAIELLEHLRVGRFPARFKLLDTSIQSVPESFEIVHCVAVLRQRVILLPQCLD